MTEKVDYTPERFERDREEMLAKQKAYIEGLKQQGDQKLLHQVEERHLTAADAHGAHGVLQIHSYVIFGSVELHLTYTDSGRRLRFDARSWGVGVGHVTVGGGGPFVAPAVLVGGCSFHVQFLAVHGGVAQVTFWRDNFGILGQFTGAGLGGGLTEMGGSGTWNWV